ncbi:hypothetical protein DDT52_10225 [Brenneria roseae subsp. roseae]|uniref:hypothetical protein n=1 Tax=Brenneria roseae TaxID=1509241 RepID=UPI000D620F0B|nr:hypothetical protein [Brenneria roseae]PWC20233.1 hypothetical protein DDT52_10225 [Brenneria roseae subsp. roseae]
MYIQSLFQRGLMITGVLVRSRLSCKTEKFRTIQARIANNTSRFGQRPQKDGTFSYLILLADSDRIDNYSSIDSATIATLLHNKECK